MKRRDKKKPQQQIDMAKERINKLFLEAENLPAEELELANRYVEIARKISMKYKVKIPQKYKRMFCKNCYSYLRPPKTCRIRLNKGKKVYYCLKCKKFTRIPYIKKS
jgi:ribonuclease P protein subunit RPR2